jgi:hypothetical protein
MNAVTTNKPSPMTVRSTWRSETKIAAGRHFTYVAGTTATVKQAIEKTRPSTIRSEPRSNDPPPAFVSSAFRTPTRATGGVTLTFGAMTVFFFGVTFFGGLAFGFTRGAVRVGVTGVTLADGVEDCRGDEVVVRGAGLGAGFGAGFGFGFGGAGSGVGTVGVGTVVGVVSSARADAGRKDPSDSPAEIPSTMAATASARATRNTLFSSPNRPSAAYRL